jgi:hypothetical protein
VIILLAVLFLPGCGIAAMATDSVSCTEVEPKSTPTMRPESQEKTPAAPAAD